MSYSSRRYLGTFEEYEALDLLLPFVHRQHKLWWIFKQWYIVLMIINNQPKKDPLAHVARYRSTFEKFDVLTVHQINMTFSLCTVAVSWPCVSIALNSHCGGSVEAYQSFWREALAFVQLMRMFGQ